MYVFFAYRINLSSSAKKRKGDGSTAIDQPLPVVPTEEHTPSTPPADPFNMLDEPMLYRMEEECLSAVSNPIGADAPSTLEPPTDAVEADAPSMLEPPTDAVEPDAPSTLEPPPDAIEADVASTLEPPPDAVEADAPSTLEPPPDAVEADAPSTLEPPPAAGVYAKRPSGPIMNEVLPDADVMIDPQSPYAVWGAGDYLTRLPYIPDSINPGVNALKIVSVFLAILYRTLTLRS